MAHDEEKLQNFLQKAIDCGIVEDGVVASEPSKIRVSILIEFLNYNILVLYSNNLV